MKIHTYKYSFDKSKKFIHHDGHLKRFIFYGNSLKTYYLEMKMIQVRYVTFPSNVNLYFL